MADPDWTDPCAVLAWLMPQYYGVLAGGQPIRIVYAGRDTTYGQANAAAITALKLRLEHDCAVRRGLTVGRRRPIIAG